MTVSRTVLDCIIAVCVATDLVTTVIFSYYLTQNYRMDFGRLVTSSLVSLSRSHIDGLSTSCSFL